jgi:hypothetical protein
MKIYVCLLITVILSMFNARNVVLSFCSSSGSRVIDVAHMVSFTSAIFTAETKLSVAQRESSASGDQIYFQLLCGYTLPRIDVFIFFFHTSFFMAISS